jgi:lipoprotein NlpI
MLHPRNRLPLCASIALLAGLASAGLGLTLAEDTEALLTKSRAAYQAGDSKGAIALADQAVAADPKNPRCYLVRATLHELAREFDKVIADCDKLIGLEPGNAMAYQRRGAAHFRANHVDECIRDFDKFIELEPHEEPYHWQRGLAYYYAGRFADGRKQFELHQTVNTADVENATWHYACVARLEGVEAARKGLIPISGDSRVPMSEIYALFGGKGTPEAVLAAARAGEPDADDLKDRLFYAHLYLGLYHEAAGDAARAREHIDLAAGEFAQTHYMGDVARVHALRLRAADRPKPDAAKPDAAKPDAPKEAGPNRTDSGR